MRALIEIAKILPPLTNLFSSNKVIHFKEVGTTGFGDRLRGISLLIFLSKLYKIDCFCYEELSSDAFPWSITDLIEIDGIRLVQGKDSQDHSYFLKVIHNSAKGTIIKRLGYEGMKRLRPKSTVVKTKIDSLLRAFHKFEIFRLEPINTDRDKAGVIYVLEVKKFLKNIGVSEDQL
jgi:hypothetical protein